MKKNMKVLVFRDQKAINEIIKNAEDAQPRLQNVFDEARLIGLQLPSEVRNWIYVILNPEDYFNKRLAEKIGTVEIAGGHNIKQSALLNLIEKPDISDFIEACNKLAPGKRFNTDLSLFIIVDNEVRISAGAVMTLKEKYSTYATTEKEKELFNTLLNVAEGLNKLGVDGFNINQIFEGGLGNYKPSHYEFKRLSTEPQWRE
jgi:hypothetical protein